MRTAAQLDRESWYRDDANDIAILLVEQRHCAARDRFLIRLLLEHDRHRGPNAAIDLLFDRHELLGLERPVMREVESQAIRLDDRARLVNMRADDLSQRRMQQMRGRVIPLRILSSIRRHARHRSAKRDLASERSNRSRSTVD